MKNIITAAALGLGVLAAQSAAAETCGGVYTVKSGDSLSLISDHLFKDVGKWSLIHTQNIKAIGSSPNAIRVGMRLDIPCIDGLPLGLEGGKLIADAVPTVAEPVEIAQGDAAVRHKINLLTGDNFQPFTGKQLHNGGLLTDLVNATMSAAEPEQGFAIHWVDHWDAHFEPLLSNALLDAGFPWYRPNCEELPESYRCENLLFSEPLFETLTLIFTDASNPIDFSSDEDVLGKSICRPAGFDTTIFNESGRNWLRDEKIELVVGNTPSHCFELVMEGEADLLVLNEFTGREKISELGLEGKIHVVPTPISIQSHHIVVHKSHPEAELILAMVNDGLTKIHDSGVYQSIIEDHMARIWAGF